MSKSKIDPSRTSLITVKETLEKMLQAVQEELHKVDTEWAQMCSIASQGTEESESDKSVGNAHEKLLASGGIDDPNVVNEMNLEL